MTFKEIKKQWKISRDVLFLSEVFLGKRKGHKQVPVPVFMDDIRLIGSRCEVNILFNNNDEAWVCAHRLRTKKSMRGLV